MRFFNHPLPRVLTTSVLSTLAIITLMSPLGHLLQGDSVSLAPEPTAWAAKKKKEEGAVDVAKALEEINVILQPLSKKAAARGMFSPDEMSQVQDVKLQMLVLLQSAPLSPELVRPTYEAAKLFLSRELYDDAFDFFNYLKTNYPSTPFGMQSAVEIQRLKQKLGDTYFSEQVITPATGAPAAGEATK